jgi:hypothetical protein
MWTVPEPKEIIRRSTLEVEKMSLVDGDCAPKSVRIECRAVLLPVFLLRAMGRPDSWSVV